MSSNGEYLKLVCVRPTAEVRFRVAVGFINDQLTYAIKIIQFLTNRTVVRLSEFIHNKFHGWRSHRFVLVEVGTKRRRYFSSFPLFCFSVFQSLLGESEIHRGLALLSTIRLQTAVTILTILITGSSGSLTFTASERPRIPTCLDRHDSGVYTQCPSLPEISHNA